MRISQVPEGSIIKCCGSQAQILKHGELGTRVNVLTVKGEHPGFVLGFQIWSSLSDVEPLTGIDTNTSKRQNTELFTQIGTKLP